MEERLQSDLKISLPKQPVIYEVKGRTFVVEPVFPEKAKETLGSVLMRLMKNDVSES